MRITLHEIMAVFPALCRNVLSRVLMEAYLAVGFQTSLVLVMKCNGKLTF